MIKLSEKIIFVVTLIIYLNLLIIGAIENKIQFEILGGFLMIYNFLVLFAFKNH